MSVSNAFVGPGVSKKTIMLNSSISRRTQLPRKTWNRGAAAQWLPAITFHIFPGPWTSSSYLGTFALLDFPLFFSPCMLTLIFIPYSFFHFLWWVEQKSFKTKMAVAGRVNLKLDEYFMRFLSLTLQSQSTNLWASFGECMVSTSKSTLGLYAQKLPLLSWIDDAILALHQFILYKSTNLINSSQK